MKAIWVICAIIGLCSSAPKPRSLADDLQDFIDLLPLEDIKALLDDSLNNDGAVVAVIVYMQGDDWHQLVDDVGSKPAVQDLIQYLTDAGLPVEDIIALIHDTIENAVPGTDPDENGSLRPFLDAMEAILPLEDLVNLLNDKLQNSPDFQELYKKVSSDESHDLVEEVRAIPEVQRLAERLRDFGVKIDEVLAAIYDFLGWGAPKAKKPRSLADDLQDFIDLLPLEDIKALLDDSLNNDGAVVAVIVYMQGDDWHQLVDDVGSKPAVQDLIQYLTDAGLPVEDIIALIHDTIENAVPGTDPDENGSLRPFLDAMEAILPLEDLVNLLNDKLQNSPDFQELYKKVSSDESHDLVEEVRAIPEVQRLAERLRDFGVKIDEVLAAIYDFLGWGAPKAKKTRSLADDLQDFIDLLPLEDIKALLDDSLNNDGAVVAVIVYMQGDDWHQLVDDVGSKPAVQDLIQYLTDAGLPVEDIIALIHDTIENAVPGTDPDENGSLRPFLDAMEAILPLEDLVNLLNDKLQNSPDFQELYKKVSSDESHDLVEEVRAIPEVQRLAERLRDFGVKIDEVLAAIYDFLGWGAPKAKKPRSLADDLQDFIDLLPLEDIKTIFDDSLNNDGAFVAVIIYLQGDDWQQLVQEVGSKPAVQDFIQYLEDAGLPIRDLIARIHDTIANAVPGTDPDANGSLRPFLDAVEALLPVDALIDLLNDKLTNSPDFQALYQKISSDKAKALVEEVRAIPEVQRLAGRLRELGVKVDEVLAAIYNFLGWGTPKRV